MPFKNVQTVSLHKIKEAERQPRQQTRLTMSFSVLLPK